jgi:hypothetical protein
MRSIYDSGCLRGRAVLVVWIHFRRRQCIKGCYRVVGIYTIHRRSKASLFYTQDAILSGLVCNLISAW